MRKYYVKAIANGKESILSISSHKERDRLERYHKIYGGFTIDDENVGTVLKADMRADAFIDSAEKERLIRLRGGGGLRMTKTYNCQTRDGLKNFTEEDIYRETQPIIWSVLFKKYSNFKYYHEDISQEVMLEVFKALERYDPTKGTVYGYIKVVTLRRVSDEVAKIITQKKHNIPLTPEMELYLRQSARADPEPDEELAPLVEKLRRKLTARERMVLELKEDGYSSIEIYRRLYPKAKNKHPGQAINKIMAGITEKAKKLGLDKIGGKT